MDRDDEVEFSYTVNLHSKLVQKSSMYVNSNTDSSQYDLFIYFW